MDSARRFLPCLTLTGCFAFILTILFSPLKLTPVASGETLPVDPFWQTVACSFVMTLTCCALVLASRAGLAMKPKALVAVTLVAAPVGTLLIPLHHLLVAPVVACLFGVASIVQLHVSAGLCSRMDKRDVALGTSMALVLSALVDAAAEMFIPHAAAATAVLGAVLTLCSAATAFLVWGHKEPAASDAKQAPDDLLDLRYDWQPLVGGAICALTFGLSFNVRNGVPVEPAPLELAGRVVCAAVLFAFFAIQGKRVASSSFSYLLSMAAGLGILVWELAATDFADASLWIVAVASQTLFLGLLWIQTQYTAADHPHPGNLICTAMAVFCLTFVAGCLLGLAVPPAFPRVAASISLLCYLFAILAAALRRPSANAGTQTASAPVEDEPRELSMKTVEQTCTDFAAAHGLSNRETELLPMLLLGLSATTIGEQLFISPQTVKTHAHRIYAKVGVHSHDELVSAVMGKRDS